MEENKKTTSSLFVTLTYDQENVPITRNGSQSLYKRDVQLFLKRLRKAHPQGKEKSSIKYFVCGEYGGFTKRPHYHFLLFGVSHDEVVSSWGLGHADFGFVAAGSIYYTLKYMMKTNKHGRKKGDWLNPKRKWSPHREFRLMSKGLGKSYVDSRGMIHWHKNDLLKRMYLNLPGGVKIGMPRYYKDRIYNDEEREDVAYAGLLKARIAAEKDKLNPEIKRQRILAQMIQMDLTKLERSKI